MVYWTESLIGPTAEFDVINYVFKLPMWPVPNRMH